MNSLFLNYLIFSDFTAAESIFYILNTSFSVVLFCFCISAYYFIRPKLPARVNCWFCNRNFLVPYTSRHCFDCRYCDQYNGFNNDGDYNVDIFERRMKTGQPIFEKHTIERVALEKSNGLCKSCNTNQQLKVQQLASFVPTSDANYDTEIDKYKEQLEKYYRLCENCNLVLTQTLQTQQYDLLTKRLNGFCRTQSTSISSSTLLKSRIAAFCDVASLFSMAFIIILTAVKSFIYSEVDRNVFPILSMWLQVLASVDIFLATSVGAFFNICSRLANFNPTPKNLLFSSVWFILLGISWLNMDLLVLIISLVSFSGSFIPYRKQVIKKTSLNATPVPKPSLVTDKESLTSHEATLPKEQAQSTDRVQNKRVPVNLERNKTTPATPGKPETPPEKPRRIETRSQSSKKEEKKKDEPKAVNGERSRLFSPPPELYNAFNSLRLKSVEPPEYEPKKLTNIFESKTSRKSILKPSKFSSDSRSVNNELTRPPSVENKSSNLVLSPISNFPPNCSVSPAFTNCEDDFTSYGANCIGSVPMSHTVVYTYGRPSPYPFNFSPQRCMVPPFSPCDPQFSANSSNASFSSTFESRKWVWFNIAISVGLFLNSILLAILFWKI